MSIAGIDWGILVLGLAPANMFWIALTRIVLADLALPFANAPPLGNHPGCRYAPRCKAGSCLST